MLNLTRLPRIRNQCRTKCAAKMASSPLWVLTGPGSWATESVLLPGPGEGEGFKKCEEGRQEGRARRDALFLVFFGEMANVMQAARTGREPSQIRVDGCTLFGGFGRQQDLGVEHCGCTYVRSCRSVLLDRIKFPVFVMIQGFNYGRRRRRNIYGRSVCWQPEPPELGTSLQCSGGQLEVRLVGTG